MSHEALALGFELRAVLPFAPVTFQEDFSAADAVSFNDLFRQADSWFHMPCTRDEGDVAYALAGEATVAQSDLMIAIWDGSTSRGIGGTADVIDYAVRRGVPVVHIDSKNEIPPRLLWAGTDGLPSPLLHKHNAPQQPLDDELLGGVIDALLLPPFDQTERANLDEFLSERPRRFRTRLEYPVLLALTGVRPLGLRNVVTPVPGPVDNPGSALSAAFRWADGLADHFAQIHRSSVVFNFAAAAGSVLVALSGILLPNAKVPLVIAELVLISGLIVNTFVGNRQHWHRRWLDYRNLAEQLRTMASLKRLGVATRALDTSATARDRRWTDFYAASLWRQLSLPQSIANGAALEALAEDTARAEIDDQIAYHHANAHRMHLLDHRLHLAGSLLFYSTILVGAVSLFGMAASLDAISGQSKLLTVLSAALPTIGAALFGIRGQGDFAGAAGRSGRTAERLERVATNLRRRPLLLSGAARTLEDAASIMLDDLGEWNAAYRHRRLAIPS